MKALGRCPKDLCKDKHQDAIGGLNLFGFVQITHTYQKTNENDSSGRIGIYLHPFGKHRLLYIPGNRPLITPPRNLPLRSALSAFWPLFT